MSPSLSYVTCTLRYVTFRFVSFPFVTSHFLSFPKTRNLKDEHEVHLLKAIKNFPNPFLWYGGNVRIHATLFPSGDSFS